MLEIIETKQTKWVLDPPIENETEKVFRRSFVAYMDSVDMVEANEIRNKMGWDQWTENQQLASLLGALTKGE